MSIHSATSPNQEAIRLNGVVWGLLLGLALAVAWLRHTMALLPLCLVLNLVAALGLCANGALLLWKLLTGQLRQVVGYALGGTVLALLLLGLNQDVTQRYLGLLPGVPVTR